jgi:hypothetical protein
MRYHQTSERASNVARIRRVQDAAQSHRLSPTRGATTARNGIQKAIRAQSEQARTKAETKARRWPRPWRLAGFRFRLLPAPDQCFVSQTLGCELGENHLEPSVIVSVLPVVKAERLFVNVAEQVIGLDANVGAVDSTLQETPKVLHAVGVDILADVFNRVIDNLMLVLFTESVIGFHCIAVEFGTLLYVLAHQRLQLSLTAALYHGSANLSAAFQNRSDDSLTFGSAPSLNLARLNIGVHVAGLAADESFIHFDFARELAASGFVLHGESDAVEHEPCGLLGHSEVAGDCVAANSVLTVGNHPNSSQPFIESNRGILENTFGLDGKLLAAFRTFPDAAGLEKHWFLRAAVLAGDALRPAAIRHFAESIVGISVVLDCFHQSLGSGGFHEPRYA